MSSILVAEDEAEIAGLVARGLESAGYSVTVAPNGEDALVLARSGRFDLILLDVGMPGLDGFEVLRRIRAEYPLLPVIMLTARVTVDDTVAGLDGGAMDYIAKPFRFQEVLARVRAALRQAELTQPVSLMRAGLTLDLQTRRAIVEGRNVDLSTREFALAEELLRHPGETLSRQYLLGAVWGFEHDPGSNILEVYISYLRDKLGAARIETVRGFGYRLL